MKKFKKLAVKEFEAQGLKPNLELHINELPSNGNFDWNSALQPCVFGY